MDRILQKPVLAVSLLVVLCGYLFCFQSGNLALTDPDETFYAQTAREMVARGEWVTPYLYGKPQFEKPILFYWLLEASYKIFGVSPFAARLPSAVFGTIGIIALYLLGGLLFNRRVGFLAALILAASVEYVVLARACVTDMVLATLMLLGVLFFYYGLERGKGYWYLLSAAAFALATLTKGPIAILLFGAVIVVYLACTRDTRIFRPLSVVGGLLIFLLIAAPWYALIYRLHGQAFIDGFFGFHNITRFLVAEHKIGSQYYYNIPILLGGLFPWSVFLPLALWRVFAKVFSRVAPVEERRRIVFLLAWFFMIFLFFTASSTKLPTYIFPSFMSMALVIALAWDDFLAGAPGTAKGMAVSFYLLAAAVFIGSVVAPVVVLHEYPSMAMGVAVSSFFLSFGFALAVWSFLRGKHATAVFAVVYALAIFLLPLTTLALPALEPYETSREVAQQLGRLMKPGERLGSESNHLAGLAFYTGVFPANLDRHHDMVTFLNSNERVWVVMKEKNQRQLYDATINPTYVKPTYILYRVDKRAIVTNAIPPDGRYLSKGERQR